MHELNSRIMRRGSSRHFMFEVSTPTLPSLLKGEQSPTQNPPRAPPNITRRLSPAPITSSASEIVDQEFHPPRDSSIRARGRRAYGSELIYYPWGPLFRATAWH